MMRGLAKPSHRSFWVSPAARVVLLGVVVLCLCAIALWSKRPPDAQYSPELATSGAAEVTARLTEIRGEFPKNKMYDYVYIMKYSVLEVHRGRVDGEEIFVGHYNPLKHRSQARDEFVETVSGNLGHFRAGDIHRMALDKPLDDHYMGGIIDKYFDQEGVRYWSFCTDRVVE